MTLQQQKKWAQGVVDEWNTLYQVGQPVVVKKDFEARGTITKTRSIATVVSCQPVVWLEGIIGCYHLDVVAPITLKERRWYLWLEKEDVISAVGMLNRPH